MFRKILVVIFVILVIWMCMPENQRVNFQIFGRKVDIVLNPPTINFQLGGFTFKKDFHTKLGLDLRGGSRLVFVAKTSDLKAEDVNDALESARDIIEKRVNYYGLSESVVQRTQVGKEHRITVELPDMQNPQDAIRLIGQTARLQFMEYVELDPKVATSPAAIYMQFSKDSGITGKHVAKATVGIDQKTGKPAVDLIFTEEGKKLFAKVTKRNIGKPLAIAVDGILITAPVVRDEIKAGNAQISGNFTEIEARNLATAINSGALPVSITLVDQKTVGPTLGALEIKKSVVAGLIGLFLLAVFMIVIYRKLGAIAVLALIIYGALSFATMRLIGLVFTLPGIAGFILAVGMAVDSNILIFERIKEELAKGKEFSVATRLGFGRALEAIKDANITTLLVAFILYNPFNWAILPQFGLVRGFALTLGIGVITSLFTGVVITKRLIWYFYKLDKRWL